MTPVNKECCSSPSQGLYSLNTALSYLSWHWCSQGNFIRYSSAFCAFMDAFTTAALQDNLLCIVFFILAFIIAYKVFNPKCMWIWQQLYMCYLTAPPNVLLCNSIRFVEKLSVALLWSLMKLLTCLMSKHATDVCVWARVSVCAHCMSERWRWKLVGQWWEQQADSAVMVSGMGGGIYGFLSWVRHAVEAD